jgi:hypothetical protein
MATVTFRTDTRTDEALAELTADGTDRSDAIRQALILAAAHRRQVRLQDVAARLAADPAYQAEVAAVHDDLREFRAW